MITYFKNDKKNRFVMSVGRVCPSDRCDSIAFHDITPEAKAAAFTNRPSTSAASDNPLAQQIKTQIATRGSLFKAHYNFGVLIGSIYHANLAQGEVRRFLFNPLRWYPETANIALIRCVTLDIQQSALAGLNVHPDLARMIATRLVNLQTSFSVDYGQGHVGSGKTQFGALFALCFIVFARILKTQPTPIRRYTLGEEEHEFDLSFARGQLYLNAQTNDATQALLKRLKELLQLRGIPDDDIQNILLHSYPVYNAERFNFSGVSTGMNE
ncbi:hypothetical protein EMMF5_006599, partial [Cystobasidiomycetes sp. EMM_F5]